MKRQRISDFRSLLWLTILALSFACAGLGLWVALQDRGVVAGLKVDGSDLHYADVLGDNPIRIAPDPIRVSLPMREEQLSELASAIAAALAHEPEPSARSRQIHASRLWKFVPTIPKWLEGNEKRIIAHVSLAAPAISESWRGVDIAELSDGRVSEHRDQMLSALGELGVPLNATIGKVDSNLTVRDLLRTSMNEFHLKQPELEWTAVAYASICHRRLTGATDSEKSIRSTPLPTS